MTTTTNIDYDHVVPTSRCLVVLTGFFSLSDLKLNNVDGRLQCMTTAVSTFYDHNIVNVSTIFGVDAVDNLKIVVIS